MNKKVALVMAVLLAALLLCSPAMASSGKASSWGDNADQDLLSGWTMYFVDFEESKDLLVEVTQANPDECPGMPQAAKGWGYFRVGQTRGFLSVEEAEWFNWPPGQGFPESAVVRGQARIGFRKQAPFELRLISHGYPDNPDIKDEAVLKIDLNGEEVFFGQLHHSRLRALF